MTPTLSIVTVSLNVADLLCANLERLFSMGDNVTREVIVIDNGSSDETVHLVATRFPQVRLIRNETNRGFAAACNQGLRVARGRVLLLLNPDMLVTEGALDHTVQTLDADRSIGVLGLRLMNEAGTEVVRSVRRDPGLLDQLAILLKVPHVFPRATDRYLATDLDLSVSQDVDQLRGSFFAFRRDVMDVVGLLDERYFIWFEEVDFCRRVREAGYRIRFLADIACVDLVGRTFKQQRTFIKQWRFSRSMAQYFFKWHGWAPGAVVTALRPLCVCMGLLYDAWRLLRRV